VYTIGDSVTSAAVSAYSGMFLLFVFTSQLIGTNHGSGTIATTVILQILSTYHFRTPSSIPPYWLQNPPFPPPTSPTPFPHCARSAELELGL